jgi:hypothetical protein
MNSWTAAIWLFSEMNSNVEALTARVPEPCDAPRPPWITGHAGAGLHQHFEPQPETIGVELLVAARLRGAPQVQIEHTGQLLGCRQRHELAALLQAAVLDDPLEDFGRQSGNNVSEVWGIQEGFEQTAAVWSCSACRNVPFRACAAGTVGAGAREVRVPATRRTDGFRHRPGDNTGTGGQQTVLNGGEG